MAFPRKTLTRGKKTPPKGNGRDSSQDLFKSCFSHAAVGFSITDLEGRFVEVNAAFCSITGYSPDELRELDFQTITHPDDLPKAVAMFQSLLAGEVPAFVLKKRKIKKNGDIVCVQSSASLIRDGEGRAVSLVRLTEDLTESEQLERQANRRTESMLAGVADVHILFDRQWRYRYINPASVLAIHRPPEKILGRTLWEIFPDIIGTELERQYRRAMDDRIPVVFDFYYPETDTWCENRFFPDAEGLAVFATDITNRKRAEKERDEAERKYRDIFDNAQEGIFQSTPEGRYVVANPAFARIFGYESPQALLADCHDISRQIYADPAQREEFKRLMETAGVVRDFEVRTLRKDGSRLWISVNARAVRDSTGAIQYYEGTSDDITERKRAQAKSDAFASLARKLSGARTYRDAGSTIAQTARDLFGWDACNVDFYDARTDLVTPLLNIDTVDGTEVNVTPFVDVAAPTARCRRVINEGPELLLRDQPIKFDADSIPFGDTKRPSASLMTVPIKNGGNVIGLISIQSYTLRAYDQTALNDFVHLAEHCAEAINRIHAEELLRESEERFRQLAENVEDVVWIADRELTQVLYINPAYERVFGRSRQSVYEHLASFVEAVHPDDRATVYQMLERQREGDYSPCEYRIIRPDGSIRWVLRRAFPIRNHEGDIYRTAGIGQDITERKRVEEELRKSEEELRLFNLATNDMFWNRDFSTGKVVRFSTDFKRVFGYAELEIDPSNSWWEDRLHPEDRPRVIDAIQAAVQRGEKTCTFEYRFRRRDGSYATLSDRAYFVRDELGNAVRAMGAMTDISERKEAAEALRESEERYRDLVENSRELICTHDLNGLVLSANPATATALGYELDEYVGKKTIRDILLPEVRDQFDEYMARLRTEGTTSGIMLVRTQSGETRTWEYYNSLRTEGVTAPIVRGMARDITEERRARKALRQSEERYRELFENSRDAIYFHDMSGRYLSVNRAAEELSGYSRAEILGKKFADFVSPDFVPKIRKHFCEKLATLGSTMYEIEVNTKGGDPVPVEVSSRLVHKEGVPVGVQGTLRDISERKHTQKILRTYSRRLVEAQEVERKKIARELHDEIGQILTAVRISLQSIQRTCEVEASARIEKSVGVIDEALDRVRELSLELRPALLDDLGLPAALRWYVQRFFERTDVKAEVISDFDDDFRLPRKLETACFRIAQEALTNVARHAHAGQVRIALNRSKHEFRLTITDDGQGFDAAALLASASSQSFGLHGVEERAFAVGGDVEVQSAPGQGTRLSAQFPLRRRAGGSKNA